MRVVSRKTFELREDKGAERLQALEDWLQAEGYGYRLRQRRWQVWRLNPGAGEGLCPDGYEEEVDDSKYRPRQRINDSLWDVIQEEFRKPGQERKLRKSPRDEKRSSGDKKRDKKLKEFQEFQAAQARAIVPIGESTTRERPRSPSTPGEDAMGDVHMGTPKPCDIIILSACRIILSNGCCFIFITGHLERPINSQFRRMRKKAE